MDRTFKGICSKLKGFPKITWKKTKMKRIKAQLTDSVSKEASQAFHSSNTSDNIQNCTKNTKKCSNWMFSFDFLDFMVWFCPDTMKMPLFNSPRPIKLRNIETLTQRDAEWTTGTTNALGRSYGQRSSKYNGDNGKFHVYFDRGYNFCGQ